MAGDEAMIADWPLPASDGESGGFWTSARRGVLSIQSCVSCNRLRHLPRPMCPWCRSLERTWSAVSGTGTVWSYVVPHPPLLPAFAPLAPYNVVVVALVEDPSIRLVGNLVSSMDGAINEVTVDEHTIGMAVRAVFVPMAEDVALVRWVRA